MLASRVLALLSFVIVAREIGPDQLGLLAVVLLVVEFLALLSEAGISSAIVQARALTLGQRALLYTLEWVLAITVLILAQILAVFLAKYFGAPELYALVTIASMTILIETVGRNIGAMLQRTMRFRVLTSAELSRNFVRAIGAIALVTLGYGIWSVVVAHVLGSIVIAMILVGIGLRDGLFPGLSFDLSKSRALIVFGAYRLGTVFLNRVGQRVDQAIVATTLETASLGAYRLASQFTGSILTNLQAVTARVTFSMFSRQQDDFVQVRQSYLRLVSIQAFVAMPIVAVLLVASGELVDIVFGDKWQGVHGLISLLALFSLFRMHEGGGIPLVNALGWSRYLFYWSMGTAACFAVTIALAATTRNVEVIAMAMLAVQICLAFLFYFVLQKPLIGPFGMEYFAAIIPAVFCSAFAVAPAIVIKWIAAPAAIGIPFFVALLSAAPLYILLSYKFNSESFILAVNVVVPRVRRKVV
ncbi:MAG: oligosaccharide flippase family protein [Parvibaculum sp.]|nr:oligosaccharide flippase family protein [Parvibaculum sp.]